MPDCERDYVISATRQVLRLSYEIVTEIVSES
jgi:hypothetical protein